MIYPMVAMIGLTVICLAYGLVLRIRAVKNKKVSASYFKVFQSTKEVPVKIIQHRNHISNLFEIPTLFYAACLAAMIVGPVTDGMMGSAWAFVLMRAVHSFIHLGSNYVPLRLGAFLLSNAALLILWIQVLLAFERLQ